MCPHYISGHWVSAKRNGATTGRSAYDQRFDHTAPTLSTGKHYCDPGFWYDRVTEQSQRTWSLATSQGVASV